MFKLHANALIVFCFGVLAALYLAVKYSSFWTGLGAVIVVFLVTFVLNKVLINRETTHQ